VHRAPGIPCALCFPRANDSRTTRAHRAARRERVFDVIARSAATKQSMIVAAVGFWIASRSLSSGAHSRDPVEK
jgi:hypothetical protein